MQRPALTLFGRLKLVFQLVLALAVFAPAVSAHACVDQNCGVVAVGVESSADDDQRGCADCGPACANGCCHAPHPATPPDLQPKDARTSPASRMTWTHSAEPPPVAASGPRRPPRA
ncbi:hypothetical protein [Brevundimonas sp.]|jgi:hypothetical protein|uniref:hypothetical protein n=1 Tax=Brevundimonas sp. TaxID=1871086 RepID=UPI0037C11D22